MSTSWPSHETGIVASDDDRLILKAFPVVHSRRGLTRLVILMVLLIGTTAAVGAFLFRAHVSVAAVLLAAVVSAAVWGYRITTEVTFIILKGSSGIIVETRNLLLRLRRRRLRHSFSEIVAVELRSRVNPNALRPGASPTGAYLHYDVVLRKADGPTLLWYTRYADAAVHIARTVATFATVPLIDSDGLLRDASAGTGRRKGLTPAARGARMGGGRF